MKKTLSYIAIGSVLIATTANGMASNCGDGNHRYDVLDQGETVFYAGDSKDFVVTRENESRVKIKDTVRCRFGEDSLLDIENVRFLDKTIAIDDLVIESAKSQLTGNLLSRFLSEHLQSLFGTEVQKQQEENEASNTRVVEADTQATFGSGFSVGSASFGSQPTAPVFTTTSFGTQNQNTNFTGNTNFNSNPVFAQQTNSSFFVQPTVQTNSSFNNPFDLFGNQSTQQFSQSQTATAVVAWDPLRVGTGQSVYFEANDVNNRHYFLGSAAGFVGSAQVTIPQAFAGQNQVTVFVKSGTRLVGTYVISLQ